MVARIREVVSASDVRTRRRLRRSVWFLVVGLVAAAYAIGRPAGEKGPSRSTSRTPAATTAPVMGSASSAAPDAARAAVTDQSGGASLPAPTGPRIVRTATVEVRVRDGAFAGAWERASAVAGRFGGYVERSAADTDGSRLSRGTLTMRVPAASVDEVLAALRGLGTVTRQSSSATDVGAQMVDFDARLRAARTQEAQFLDLLGRARAVNDILEVRTRVDQVRREIESLQAQRDHLQSQVDLASITATVFEPAGGAATVPRGRLAEAWNTAADVFVSIVAGSVVLGGAVAPFAVLALVGLAIWRLGRRRRMAPAA